MHRTQQLREQRRNGAAATRPFQPVVWIWGSFWQEVTESFGPVGPSRVSVGTREDEQLPGLSPIPSPEGPQLQLGRRGKATAGGLPKPHAPARSSRRFPSLHHAALIAPPRLHGPISLPSQCLLQQGDPGKWGASPPKGHIFPLCRDALRVGMCNAPGRAAAGMCWMHHHRDALPLGCAAVGMHCLCLQSLRVQARSAEPGCWARPDCPVS